MEAKHDISLAKRAPKLATVLADEAAAGPSKPAKPNQPNPAPNSAAGQIAGIMAGTAALNSKFFPSLSGQVHAVPEATPQEGPVESCQTGSYLLRLLSAWTSPLYGY